MVKKWPHISCERFSRYILTKIAKIWKFVFYSFIYLQVVPAFNGAGQVSRNIIKPEAKFVVRGQLSKYSIFKNYLLLDESSEKKMFCNSTLF